MSDPVISTVARLEPISLDDLNAAASLMTRVDRKYFVPRSVLAEILTNQFADVQVLQIDGTRLHAYQSTYFDTPNFDFFRHHVQRRRHRAKVRTRTYSTGDRFLEVKTKGYRGETVKHRMFHPHPTDRLDELSAKYISQKLSSGQVAGVRALMPVVETHYERVTLTRGGDRMTCDLNLRFVNGTSTVDGPDEVLVETKSAGRSGPMDAELRRRGIRAISVSKYCLAMALHYPDLPANPWNRLLNRYFSQAWLRCR